MSVWQAMILGIVQGLTEFLPVSSSGHLVLVEHLLRVQRTHDITFEVFVHFGTLLSVVVVLWKDVVLILQSLLHALKGAHLTPTYYRENEYFRVAVCIVVASIPAAFIGIRYEGEITAAFTDPKLVAVMLILTGLILFMTRLARPSEGKEVGLLSALVIGIAQAVAIIPGISRSGSTISAGMYQGIAPLRSARFSFLLSVPVIGGATILKTKELIEHGIAMEDLIPLLVGTIISFASGYFAIKFLLRVISQGRFVFFALYCLTIGTLGVFFLQS